MRQLRLDKGPHDSNVPPVTKDLNPVLLPAKVVAGNLSVGLKCGIAFVNQPDMIDQEDRCQEESSHVDRPEEDSNLGPGDVHA